MLPIKIRDQKGFNEVGLEIVDTLYTYVSSICRLGYYTIECYETIDGKRKLQHKNIYVHDDSKPFFEKINKISTIKNLIFMPAHKLPKIIELVDSSINIEAYVRGDIYSLFVDVLYSKRLQKGKLIDSIGLQTCPYCNRGYIYTIKSGNINPQIDHFYPKALYPLFAVSLYNLIPSCSVCNSAGCKGSKDTLKENKYRLTSPYLLKHEDFHFNYKLLSPEIIKGEYTGEEIEVVLDHCAYESHDRIFHIRELYKKHDDHIVEMLYKRKYIYTDDYLKSLLEITKSKISKTVVNQFIVGNFIEKDDYHKRPLSKMYTEIAREIGLIEKDI